MSKFKLSRSSKKNLSGVRPEIKELVSRVLAKSNIDFGIPQWGGLRTAQEQNNLFHTRDKNGRRVTFLDGFQKISYHQTGNAFDIFVYYEGAARWEGYEHMYDELSILFKEEFCLMQEEGIFDENEVIEWGGDWKRFIDRPHFEIRKR